MRNLPIITLGMPTYNCAWSLVGVLNAIAKLDYPKDRIRIVFVDNNSEDETARVLRDFQQRFGSDYESVIIVSEKSNIPEARNICVSNSIGEYVLFIDSDVIPPPETIRGMLKLFASNPRVRVVGYPYRYDPMPFPERMLFSKHPPVPYATARTKMGCTIIKRELFSEIGLFDPKYNMDEDADLTVRVSEAGYIVIIDPTRSSLHLRRGRLYGTMQQIIRYCIGVFKTDATYYSFILREHKPRWLIGRIIFYLAMVASIPLAVVGAILGRIYLILPLIACYSFVFAYHFPKASGKWRLINSVIFPLFGMSFALGILKEIFKYCLLGRRHKL